MKLKRMTYLYCETLVFYDDVLFGSSTFEVVDLSRVLKNMLDVMSKFLLMGMDLPSVIRASTWKPAQVIKREELD